MPLLGNISSNNLKNTASNIFCRVDPLNGSNYSSRPNAVGATQLAVNAPIRDINPQSGDPIPVESYSTSGSGFVSYTTTALRSEEHTSELQSLMRISYAVFCLKKKKQTAKKN